MNPMTMRALTGAGVGGVIGGMGGMLRKRRNWKTLLRDALIGAGGGAGITLLSDAIAGKPTDKPSPTLPTDPVSLDPVSKPRAPKEVKQMSIPLAAGLGGISPLAAGLYGAIAGGREDGASGALIQGAASVGASGLGGTGMSMLANKLGAPMGSKKQLIAALFGNGIAAAGTAAGGNYLRAKEASQVDPSVIGQSNLFSDALALPGSDRRAGRAAGLAEGLDVDAPATVKYPSTTRLLRKLLTTGAGVGLGHLATKDDPENHRAGMAVGGGAGFATGMIWDALARRKALAETRTRLEQAVAEGRKARPILNSGSLLASLVSGVHQQGRADAAEHLSYGRRNFQGNPAMTAANFIPGGGVIEAPGSLLNYIDSARRLRNARPQVHLNPYV